MRNVGVTDSWVRIIVGMAILSLLVIVHTGWRWIGLVGLVPLLTGIFNFCPAYALLGINTIRKK